MSFIENFIVGLHRLWLLGLIPPFIILALLVVY